MSREGKLGQSDREPVRFRTTKLEEEATRLLVASLKTHGRGEYPFYTASYLRRMAAADRAMSVQDEVDEAEPRLPSLSQIWAAARRARLSPMESDLLRTLAGGWELSDAARVLGLSRSRARKLLRRMAEKVFQGLREMEQSLDEQIADVLREEQSRRAYGAERHCREGQEACRRTGLCTRRWYLR